MLCGIELGTDFNDRFKIKLNWGGTRFHEYLLEVTGLNKVEKKELVVLAVGHDQGEGAG